MNEQAARSLTAFARRLVRPATAVSAPTTVRPRYPFSDEEPALSEAEVMMARYGMRPATPAELAIFPTHPLVIAVIKVRIKQIGRPVYTDMGSPNLIVWAVESYPGSHQFRMPNGDLLHEQYNEIVWEPVPLITPISTLATIQQERFQQEWRQTARHSLRQHLTLANGR
jgi:hypothetical protein